MRNCCEGHIIGEVENHCYSKISVFAYYDYGGISLWGTEAGAIANYTFLGVHTGTECVVHSE